MTEVKKNVEEGRVCGKNSVDFALTDCVLCGRTCAVIPVFSTVWVLRIELHWVDLVASVFTK